MKVAAVLALIIATGFGGVYLFSKPKQLRSAQQVNTIVVKPKISKLERARRATFTIYLTNHYYSGSGIVVSRQKLKDGSYLYRAITARHIILDMIQKEGATSTPDRDIKLVFQIKFNGEPLYINTKVVSIGWSQPKHDWAAFQFASKHKLDCAKIATKKEFEAIKYTDDIYLIGSGGGYISHIRKGNIGTTHNLDIHKNQYQRYADAPWHKHPNDFFRPYINVWYGDSGGPVLNKDGLVIGIVNGFAIVKRDDYGVTHSCVALKSYLILDVVKDSKNFFIVEE